MNPKRITKPHRPVAQLTPDGRHLIREFRSLAEAAEAVGGQIPTIQHCAQGSQERAYGYQWRFLNHDPKVRR